MSTPNNFLRRYTDLPSAINIIRRKQITLLSPSTWDDLNDRNIMEAYKRSQGMKAVLALCFAECLETYHHWKVFTPGTSGVCIEFHREELIKALPESICYSPMIYKSISRLNSDEIDVHDLPFLKRIGFADEKEFRIVFTSMYRQYLTKNIPIPLSAINRVIINPWLHRRLFGPVAEMFCNLAKDDDFSVTRSVLIDSPAWRHFANGYDRPLAREEDSLPAHHSLSPR